MRYKLVYYEFEGSRSPGAPYHPKDIDVYGTEAEAYAMITKLSALAEETDKHLSPVGKNSSKNQFRVIEVE